MASSYDNETVLKVGSLGFPSSGYQLGVDTSGNVYSLNTSNSTLTKINMNAFAITLTSLTTGTFNVGTQYAMTAVFSTGAVTLSSITPPNATDTIAGMTQTGATVQFNWTPQAAVTSQPFIFVFPTCTVTSSNYTTSLFQTTNLYAHFNETTIVSSGGNITAWNDLLGHLNMTTVGGTCITSTFNSKTVLESNTNAYIRSPSSYNMYTNDFHFFILMTTTSTGDVLINEPTLAYLSHSGNSLYYNAGDTQTIGISPMSPLSAWFVLHIYRLNSTGHYYCSWTNKNGSGSGVSTNAYVPFYNFGSSGSFPWGLGDTGGARLNATSVAEIFYYNGTLSTSDQSGVIAYLMSKWNV